MRKGLFAIVLVAAAFGGGAAVNGPGLRWAKEMIWSKMPSDDESEDPSDLVQPSVGPVAASDESPSADPGHDAKEEPFSGDASSKEKPKGKPQTSAPGPKAPEPSEFRSVSQTESKSPDPKTPSSVDNETAGLDELPPLNVPKGSGETPPELPPPGSETVTSSSAPGTLPPLEETPASSLASKEQASKQPAKSPNSSWGDMPGSAPATAVPPRPFVKQPDRDPAAATTASPAAVASSSAPAAPRSSGDWSEIRRKMRELGVTRYGMEGEPGGRVRFHCIIPVAGKRAVGQHFEAEGDDEIQAATTMLRRVTLWRATESAAR